MSAVGMNRVGDLLPRGYLIRRVNRRCPGVAEPRRRGRSAFGNDQSGCGTLRVVLDGNFRRNGSGVGAATRHRRHDHTVSRFESVDAAGSKKVDVWHLVFSVHLLKLRIAFAIG